MTLWKHTNVGRVVQIIGNVVDVEFGGGQLPAIYNAVRIVDEGELSNEKLEVTVEVQQHLGENRVRSVAMQPTDGLVRGMEATDTGQPIAVPVGEQVLGHIFNLLGDPLDDRGDLTHPDQRWPIHRSSAPMTDTLPATEVLETGIKVVDVLER